MSKAWVSASILVVGLQFPMDAPAAPSWFDEAKLGIFIHWNAASIPAFAPVTTVRALSVDAKRSGQPDPQEDWRKLPYAEMYETTMQIPDSATARYHAEHYGTMPYDGFVTQFRDQMIPGWDPEAWATLFARAGARYVVLTTKTEDGFLLWPSVHRNPRKENWQSPRDAVGELAGAVRAQGLRFGVYYSGGADSTFGGFGPEGDTPATEEYRSYVDGHWRELIERYHPDVLWNDYSYPGAEIENAGRGQLVNPAARKHVEDLFRFYVTRVPQGVVNDRFAADAQYAGKMHADFVTLEYSGQFKDPKAEFPAIKWEACQGMGTSFGYNALEDENSYMSSAALIHMLVEIVARGGNLLINVGPMATGEIPWLQAQRLLYLGWWLRTNGNAIYGTRPWTRVGGITSEGLEVRYTSGKDSIFAILLGTPKSRTVELDLKLGPQTKVALEGWGGDLHWSATPHGVRIELPMLPDERPAWSLRFTPQAAVNHF